MNRPRFHVSLQKLLWVAMLLIWMLYLISFLLPATNVAEAAGAPIGTPLTGYQAFLLMLNGGLHPFVFLPFPVMLILVPIILLGNFVIALLPIAAIPPQFSPVVSCVLGGIAIVGAIAVLKMPADLKGTVFVGYYLWIISMMAGGLVLIGFSLVKLADDYEE